MQFRDFIIHFNSYHPIEESWRISIIQSPGGQATGRLHLPFPSSRFPEILKGLHTQISSDFESPAHNSQEGSRISPNIWAPNFQPTPLQFGDALFRGLFTERKPAGCFQRSWGRIMESPDLGLRLCLGFSESSVLSMLPWEYLYHPDDASFPALSRRFALIRQLKTPVMIPPLGLQGPVRMLFAYASPVTLDDLDIPGELETIRDACKGIPGLVMDILPNVRIDNLRAKLLEGNYNILHFVGHGCVDHLTQVASLLFENGQGREMPLTGPVLAQILADFRHSLRLVFLNACNSGANPLQGNAFAGIASSLMRSGLPAIVAMQFPIEDQDAARFAATFYRRLVEGDRLESAMAEGRQAIFTSHGGAMDWATPVLYLRTSGSRIFTSRRPAMISQSQPDPSSIENRALQKQLQPREQKAQPYTSGEDDKTPDLHSGLPQSETDAPKRKEARQVRVTESSSHSSGKQQSESGREDATPPPLTSKVDPKPPPRLEPKQSYPTPAWRKKTPAEPLQKAKHIFFLLYIVNAPFIYVPDSNWRDLYIGRQRGKPGFDGNDIVVRFPHSRKRSLRISRRHLMIRNSGNCFYLTNLSRQEATLLNGSFMPTGRQEVLRTGDRITLASSLVFECRIGISEHYPKALAPSEKTDKLRFTWNETLNLPVELDIFKGQLVEASVGEQATEV